MQPQGSPWKVSIYPTHLQSRDKREVSWAFINICRSTLKCTVHCTAEWLTLQQSHLWPQMPAANLSLHSPLDWLYSPASCLLFVGISSCCIVCQQQKMGAGGHPVPETFILHIYYASRVHSTEMYLIICDAAGFCCSWTLEQDLNSQKQVV